MPSSAVLWLHPDAPAKPAHGAPCNGCGWCCLLEPCPLGAIVSRRSKGACVALRWSDSDKRYLCGMVIDAESITGLAQPWLLHILTALAQRWIAVGKGCDAWLDAQPASEPPKSPI